MKWKKKYYTPLFYILPTHSRGWIWRNFNESAQVTRYRSINQLIWFFLYISQSQGKKVKKKNTIPSYPSIWNLYKSQNFTTFGPSFYGPKIYNEKVAALRVLLKPYPTNQPKYWHGELSRSSCRFVYCRFSFSVKL